MIVWVFTALSPDTVTLSLLNRFLTVKVAASTDVESMSILKENDYICCWPMVALISGDEEIISGRTGSAGSTGSLSVEHPRASRAHIRATNHFGRIFMICLLFLSEPQFHPSELGLKTAIFNVKVESGF